MNRNFWLQLLELLEVHTLDEEIVLMAAPALTRVLMGAQQATMAALEQGNGLAILAAAVTRQERAAAAAQQVMIVAS